MFAHSDDSLSIWLDISSRSAEAELKTAISRGRSVRIVKKISAHYTLKTYSQYADLLEDAFHFSSAVNALENAGDIWAYVWKLTPEDLWLVVSAHLPPRNGGDVPFQLAEFLALFSSRT